MTTPIFTNRYATHPDDVRHYDTEELRQHFLLDNLMQPDLLVLNYTHYERMLVGRPVRPNRSSSSRRSRSKSPNAFGLVIDANMLCPPPWVGPARHLAHQLERPLCGAKVRSLQAKVGIYHPHERQMWEIVPLGHDLRADDDIRAPFGNFHHRLFQRPG